MAYPYERSASEQQQIQQWLAAHSTPQQVALRCWIVLATAEGQSDVESGSEQVHHQQYLAGRQSEAPSSGDVQAVARSPVPGEDHRRRGVVLESAPTGDRAVRVQEKPDLGAGSNPIRLAIKKSRCRPLPARSIHRLRAGSIEHGYGRKCSTLGIRAYSSCSHDR